MKKVSHFTTATDRYCMFFFLPCVVTKLFAGRSLVVVIFHNALYNCETLTGLLYVSRGVGGDYNYTIEANFRSLGFIKGPEKGVASNGLVCVNDASLFILFHPAQPQICSFFYGEGVFVQGWIRKK
jgi:hypothetical protein